jgi:uncharacterized protein
MRIFPPLEDSTKKANKLEELTMDREGIEKILKEHKEILAEQYFVQKIGLFGSYVRNEQKEESDVDILVEFDGPVSFEFLDLKDYLESLFCKPVDLVTTRSLKPYLREEILNEVRFQ